MPKKYTFKVEKTVTPEEILKELKKLNESFLKMKLLVVAINEDVNDIKDAIELNK